MKGLPTSLATLAPLSNREVELIIEETGWEPASKPLKDHEIVGVHVDFQEKDLQNKVREANGTGRANFGRSAMDGR